MIEIFYILYSLICFKSTKYIGPLGFLCGILLLFTAVFSYLIHPFSFQLNLLNFISGVVYFFYLLVVLKKFKFIYKLKKKISLTYNKKTLLVICLTILFIKFSFTILYDIDIEMYRMINTIDVIISLIVYPIIFFLVIKNDRFSYLLIIFLLIPNLFGESRGAIIFPLFFTFSVIKVIHNLKFNFSKLLILGILTLSILILINNRRYNTSNLTDFTSNIISRGDAVFHYKYSMDNDVKISRSFSDAMASTFLFIVPRNFWVNKPYLSTFELTKAAYGTSIDNIVSLNMSVFWFDLIENKNTRILFYLTNIFFLLIFSTQINYFFKIRSLYILFLIISLAPDLLLLPESGLFDSPSGRKIITKLILSPIGFYFIKKTLFKNIIT